MEIVSTMGGAIGLDLNHSKCELIHSPHLRDSLKIPFREAQPVPGGKWTIERFPLQGVDETCLLGAPLVCGPAMNRILEERCIELERTIGRLKLLASQDALLILRSAFGSSKMLNVLRSSPCVWIIPLSFGSILSCVLD